MNALPSTNPRVTSSPDRQEEPSKDTRTGRRAKPAYPTWKEVSVIEQPEAMPRLNEYQMIRLLADFLAHYDPTAPEED